MKVELVPIENLRQAYQVRKIRNECRLFMTNVSSELSLCEQFFWYYTIYKKNNKRNNMYCYLLRVGNKNCGFGFVRKSSGKYWITGGLLSCFRGKGYGKILFTGLINSLKQGSIWLEVLESNTVALTLYKSLGFKKTKTIIRNKKKIYVMNLIKNEEI